MKEFVIWGLTKDKFDPIDEIPLFTNASSKAECDAIMIKLASNHGCHRMRVQVIDGLVPDFASCVAI